MARTTLTKVKAQGSFGTYGAGTVDVTMAAADVANGNQWACSGNDLLVAHNTGASAYTVTVTSVADPITNRTGNITTYSLAAGDYAVFGPFGAVGWQQSDGYIYVDASNASVKLGVVQLS